MKFLAKQILSFEKKKVQNKTKLNDNKNAMKFLVKKIKKESNLTLGYLQI
jgi:fatty acid-binding protein DegV